MEAEGRWEKPPSHHGEALGFDLECEGRQRIPSPVSTSSDFSWTDLA
jgi:hypothetical protein